MALKVDPRKRNFILMFLDSIFFTNAMTFISVNAVITYFLSTLGASTFEIGLANALVSIGAFASQPIYAKKAMNLTLKLASFVQILMAQRIFFLLFICTIPIFAVSHPRLMVFLFLLCWGIFNWFVGSYGPFYMSVFAKMIAEQQRGKLRGFSAGLGNLFALGAAVLTGILLKNVPFPYNYTIIFAIGAIILIADALLFAAMKEEPDEVTPVRINYFQYFAAIPGAFRENKKFMVIVISFAFMMITQVTLAYYVLYAVRIFGAGASEVALFTGITGLVNIIGSVFFGMMADRYGHRLILLISSALGAVAGFIVVGSPHLWMVYIAFGLTNLSLSGYNLSSGILIIENVRREKLPMSISINLMATMVVSSIVMVGGSFLVDYISFASLFLIAGVAGVGGCVALYGKWKPN